MKATEINKDFLEWPGSWSGGKEDLFYSGGLLEIFEAFVAYLDQSGLTKKTIRRHMSNLWLLGGELVRTINLEETYDMSPEDHLREELNGVGGPFCRHLGSEEEWRSYDATCKKLYKFLHKEKMPV
uniref:Core-binding (CB) domain-containing protein n=1 Tax=Candidatus Kentrum sp. DK TaxID=2126562 RepID=A0A450RTU3_9GAMM|nr:MAG: hypothetical protein BECKDK2373B_GA0170837_10024 [Candidatus Kentron sp. DK]